VEDISEAFNFTAELVLMLLDLYRRYDEEAGEQVAIEEWEIEPRYRLEHLHQVQNNEVLGVDMKTLRSATGVNCKPWSCLTARRYDSTKPRRRSKLVETWHQGIVRNLGDICDNNAKEHMNTLTHIHRDEVFEMAIDALDDGIYGLPHRNQPTNTVSIMRIFLWDPEESDLMIPVDC
jgi:hypothetical protein